MTDAGIYGAAITYGDISKPSGSSWRGRPKAWSRPSRSAKDSPGGAIGINRTRPRATARWRRWRGQRAQSSMTLSV